MFSLKFEGSPQRVVRPNLSPYVKSAGMSLSAGSSPLHSPKITPHTSPAPRRRSHTPNPANYMVPTTASEQGTQVIQKETVGGTTYFYTDNTPAPMAGMVRADSPGSSCSPICQFSFLSIRKSPFSVSAPGVSHLPYLSLHCTPRGLHAAQS